MSPQTYSEKLAAEEELRAGPAIARDKEADIGVKVVVHATGAGEEELEDAKRYIAEEHEFTDEEYRKLRRKFDLILLPLFMFTYGIQFMDAVVFGLRQDTHLVGNQYANLTTFFYVAFALAQFPMSWLIQRFPIGRSLSIMIILWGIVVVCIGVCNNYAQLIAVRILLGALESVISPGFAIITSSWYLRSEQTIRQNCYYSMNTMFNIVLSVLIYLLAKRAESDGKVAAWRVIQYFLGALTILAGILDLIFIGTPTEVWWLTKREKEMAHARIVSNATGGGEQHPWKWSQVKECFKDPQYYFFMVFNCAAMIPNGANITFNNLIYMSFGFTNFQTILWSLPALSVAFLLVVGPAILVHKYPCTRFFVGATVLVMCTISYLLTGLLPVTTNKWTKWGVYILANSFAGPMWLMWPLMTINVAGRTKKAWLSASSLITFCIGNIIGSQTFRPSDAPRYTRGITASALVMLANAALMICWRYYYVWANKRRDREFAASGLTEEEADFQRKLAGETDMTDFENVHFRYTY